MSTDTPSEMCTVNIDRSLLFPRSKVNKVDKQSSTPKRQSQNHSRYCDHDDVSDLQLLLYLIRLVEKVMKYDDIYYKRVENRRQRQNDELQVLTTCLQNICNDLKNI